MNSCLQNDAVRSTPDADDLELAEFIRQHPKLFVLTGAGCSTASGLGDYRDKNGQWKRRQPITGQIFIGDEAARKRYWARSSVGWPSFSQALPGLAHHALMELQLQGRLVSLVTQNVDSLHQKAGHRNTVDLHGVLATVSCIDCAQALSRDDFQARLLAANPWLSSLTAQHAPDGDADLEISDLNTMQVPACTHCGGLLKPDVVFFGENVPREKVQQAMSALASADALLVAGSSLMVYSGYRFCLDAQKRGQPIVIVNNGLTRADSLASLKIQGDCGQRLSTLAALVAS
ncbi:NAD-dependent protein deacetylase [Granulosicoccus antarcticus]|uniref:protein acetyllysine N-acetyltransferase n=1 Tax=Granulosicoccus antarcticus IMCC3135 TaxID=1192854 RepID=A0A2Z2NJ65_9GAMM|nr:NAD-dependent protein deacetylase [Granulosicoccus antarcticus]ASJ71123.1 NAD-dependent protein deacetylase [Granulosicoccus antarcticus IMCC3135]